MAVKWFVPEAGHEQAKALLTPGRRLIAPELIYAEVANAFWSKVRRGEMIPTAAQEATEQLVAATFLVVHELRSLTMSATAIAVEISHPICDCYYLALAQSEGCQVITADARLVGVVRGTTFEDLVDPL